MEKTLRVLNRIVKDGVIEQYAMVTELFRQKAQRRKRLARLSFEEKIAVVEKWRKLTRRIRNSQSVPHLNR